MGRAADDTVSQPIVISITPTSPLVTRFFIFASNRLPIAAKKQQNLSSAPSFPFLSNTTRQPQTNMDDLDAIRVYVSPPTPPPGTDLASFRRDSAKCFDPPPPAEEDVKNECCITPISVSPDPNQTNPTQIQLWAKPPLEGSQNLTSSKEMDVSLGRSSHTVVLHATSQRDTVQHDATTEGKEGKVLDDLSDLSTYSSNEGDTRSASEANVTSDGLDIADPSDDWTDSSIESGDCSSADPPGSFFAADAVPVDDRNFPKTSSGIRLSSTFSLRSRSSSNPSAGRRSPVPIRKKSHGSHNVNFMLEGSEPPAVDTCMRDVGSIRMTLSHTRPLDAEIALMGIVDEEERHSFSSSFVTSIPEGDEEGRSRSRAATICLHASDREYDLDVVRTRSAPGSPGRRSNQRRTRFEGPFKELKPDAHLTFEAEQYFDDDDLEMDFSFTAQVPESAEGTNNKGQGSEDHETVESDEPPLMDMPTSASLANLTYRNGGLNKRRGGLPNGSCLFSRTFITTKEESEPEYPYFTTPPIVDASSLRSQIALPAALNGISSNDVKRSIAEHYPAVALPKLIRNGEYTIGRLVTVTWYQSFTGLSGTVVYHQPNKGWRVENVADPAHWELSGKIVSTVWEAKRRKQSYHGTHESENVYIKTLLKSDPRQLYNPFFLRTIRKRYSQFPELIAEWETPDLNVLAVKSRGRRIRKRTFWDKLRRRRFCDVDWPVFVK